MGEQREKGGQPLSGTRSWVGIRRSSDFLSLSGWLASQTKSAIAPQRPMVCETICDIFSIPLSSACLCVAACGITLPFVSQSLICSDKDHVEICLDPDIPWAHLFEISLA